MEIYVDGSYRPHTEENRKYGGIGVYSTSESIPNISETVAIGPVNNHTFEITAVLRALQQSLDEKSITIFTDSQFVIQHLTTPKFVPDLNTYKKCNGKKPENVEIIVQCLEIMSERKKKGFKTSIRFVKGHSNSDGNRAADKLAGKASKRFIVNK